MALTKVSGHIIDQPFDVGIITATNQYVSGIGTFGNIRVLGDLQVDGTTTTLDTVVTEVDRLEVAANNNTVAIAVTQSGSGDILNLYDGATEVFTVTDGGKIGIGTNNPSELLHLQSGHTKQILKSSNLNTASSLIFDVHNVNTADFLLGQLAGKWNGTNVAYIQFEAGQDTTNKDDGVITFHTSASGGSPTERLRINSAGSVGIGTNNPVYKLDVRGTSRFTDYIYGNITTNKIYVADDLALSATKKLYFDTGSNTYIHEPTGDQLAVVTGGTEAVRITAAGNIGIGDNSPNERLEVRDTGNTTIRIYNEDDSEATVFFHNTGSHDRKIVTANADMIFYGGSGAGTEHVRIKNTGKVGIGTDNPVGNLEVRDSKANLIVAKDGLTVKSNSDLHTTYDMLQIGAGGALASYSIATATADTQLAHNAYRHSGGQQKYRYADTAMRLRMNSPGGTFIFESAASGSANADITFTERLRITSDGKVRVPDNGKFVAGAGDDLQIYHDATDSIIDNTNGDLYLKTTGSGDDIIIRASDDVIIQTQGSEGAVIARGNGTVELYYDGSKKFETTTTGAKVTGALEVTQEYPSIRPTLDLNFAATKTLDRRITFTRDSVGTYTDDMGILKYASNNTPRFDHDFDTGESLGLLIEESSTNISRNSEDANAGANWNQFGSISENIIEAPDGSLTADKLEAPSSGYGLVNIGASWTANVAHTFSIFAKSAEFNRIGIRVYDGTSYFIRTTVNLDTGETAPGNNGAGTLKVEKFANGWWRISVTGTPVATYNYNALIAVEPHNTAIVQNNDPSSSQEGIYIWGWQMEAKGFPTSYIPTSGSTATRAADKAKITGTNFTDFHNTTEGTLYGEYKATLINNAPYLVMLSDGTNNNRTIINADYTSYQGVVKYNNGTNQAVLDGGTPTLGGNNKTTLAFKKDDFALSLNGGTVATDTSGDVSVNNMMTIGSRHGEDSFMNTTIKAIKYYTKRLPNAQLQGLTQQ